MPAVAIEEFEMFADGLDHPEGIAFDRDGNLWAGGESGQVYRINQRGKVSEIGNLGGFNLGLTVSARQTLFICNLGKRSLVEMDRRGRVLRSWERTGRQRFQSPNFSVFDSAGNLYFSDSGKWMQDDGFIFVLRPSGRVETFAGPLAFPNGLALNAAEDTLFVVQSTADNVLAIPIKRDGSAGRARVFARGLRSVPDGIAFDADGNLYVTCYASHTIYKVSPNGKATVLAADPRGTMLASPTNLAFAVDGSDYVYFANLGRWHVCRSRAGVQGMPLAGTRDGASR